MSTKFKVGDIIVLTNNINNLYSDEYNKKQVVTHIGDDGYIWTKFIHNGVTHRMYYNSTYVKHCEHHRDMMKVVPQFKFI